MDIESLVTKYERLIPAGAYTLAEGIRAALTEQAEAYEERIRQMEAERVPEGYVVVPVEPTKAMLDAAGMCTVAEGKAWLDADTKQTWAAMLAAAPAKEGE